jgi:HEAT repeat protein
LSHFDETHLLNYARALAICGTERSRGTLSRWTKDSRPEVRAAAFEALGHVGLDDDAAGHAIEALERDDDASVRAMAAFSLQGWEDGGDAAAHLARRLDDMWPVAIRAARSLQSSRAGRLELEARTSRPDIIGVLARQMLWQESARC